MKFKSLEDLNVLLPDSEKPASRPFSEPVSNVPSARGHDGRKREVRIRLDRKGRKGKTVTLITGMGHNPDTMKEMAHTLKERCGTGGTVKEGNIELQGDQRERATEELEKMNYIVK
jgi:translation initiation factor 1